MTARKKTGGRRQPPGGRPPKGNSRLVCYVKPETRKAIEKEADRIGATLGEVIDQMQRGIDTLAHELADAERRAEGSFRAYALTEKYHNEDLVWLEKIIAAARATVSGPDSANYNRLGDALDAYDRWRKIDHTAHDTAHGTDDQKTSTPD